MRPTKLSILFLFEIDILTFMLTLPITSVAANSTTIYVDPQSSTVEIYQTFQINISISEVTDLAGWDFKLYYPNSLLNATELTEGPFLKTAGDTIFYEKEFTDYFNATHGRIWGACVLMGTGPGADGNGTLATITFRAKSGGVANLHLAETDLIDSKMPEPGHIPHTSLDGLVLIESHDVAVTDVSPIQTLVGQGCCMSINVTVENQGIFSETFNVTTYYNRTGTIPNGDFENDPAGTSYNDTSNWNHSSKDIYGGSVVENFEIVDDYYFSGNKSLYSYVKSDDGKFMSLIYQYLWTENPVNASDDYVSLWIAGDGYTTSSRYSWYIGLHLADGTNSHFEKLRCDCWGDNEGCTPDHYDYYNATRTGADGRTWKRYTRRIPDNIDKSNLTIKICHCQCSWSWSSASSWYRLDSIYFSDSEGNPFGLIETKTVTNLPPSEETTLTFTWNTTGKPKGNYTISAYVTPVLGEADIYDNTFIDGWVVVTIPGDVDGDFDVDLYDAVALLTIYGAKIGDPQYDPNKDIDNDGDIDLYDAVKLLTNYGKKDP